MGVELAPHPQHIGQHAVALLTAPQQADAAGQVMTAAQAMLLLVSQPLGDGSCCAQSFHGLHVADHIAPHCHTGLQQAHAALPAHHRHDDAKDIRCAAVYRRTYQSYAAMATAIVSCAQHAVTQTTSSHERLDVCSLFTAVAGALCHVVTQLKKLYACHCEQQNNIHSRNATQAIHSKSVAASPACTSTG